MSFFIMVYILWGVLTILSSISSFMFELHDVGDWLPSLMSGSAPANKPVLLPVLVARSYISSKSQYVPKMALATFTTPHGHIWHTLPKKFKQSKCVGPNNALELKVNWAVVCDCLCQSGNWSRTCLVSMKVCQWVVIHSDNFSMPQKIHLFSFFAISFKS